MLMQGKDSTTYRVGKARINDEDMKVVRTVTRYRRPASCSGLEVESQAIGLHLLKVTKLDGEGVMSAGSDENTNEDGSSGSVRGRSRHVHEGLVTVGRRASHEHEQPISR